MSNSANYINHIGLVLDASASMGHLRDEVVKVADSQIEYLARRSKELDQETRATVYVFNTEIKCIFYDKDVLRLPSLRGHYNPDGWTRLMDATGQALDDMQQTPELYGDHAHLLYVITDGEENKSRLLRAHDLKRKIDGLPDNWTTAVLVPDQRGVFEAKKFGFPANNIAVWDATSARGLNEAVETIRRATDNFMVSRSKGVRSSLGLFTPDIAAVKVSRLAKLPPTQYHIYRIDRDEPISSFCQRREGQYRIGSAYYQLIKKEEIQPTKQIAIMNKRNGDVYVGHEARQMLALPASYIKVEPTYSPEYDIFVQSTSQNRKLIAGQSLLVMR